MRHCRRSLRRRRAEPSTGGSSSWPGPRADRRCKLICPPRAQPSPGTSPQSTTPPRRRRTSRPSRAKCAQRRAHFPGLTIPISLRPCLRNGVMETCRPVAGIACAFSHAHFTGMPGGLLFPAGEGCPGRPASSAPGEVAGAVLLTGGSVTVPSRIRRSESDITAAGVGCSEELDVVTGTICTKFRSASNDGGSCAG